MIRMDSSGGGGGPGAPPSFMGDTCYDWRSEENAGKWRGLFVEPLQKVLIQVHPQFTAKDDALEYVESLLIRLLANLTSKPPLTVTDVEKRVKDTFPNPIDAWAMSDANKALKSKKNKSVLVLPFDKVHSLLKEVLHSNKLDDQVTLYLVAVLDYIAADILKLAGNYVKNMGHQVISCQDIKLAMCADKVLMDLFYQDEGMGNVISLDPDPSDMSKQEQSYDEVVKEFIIDEKKYLRDLHMITKVFRDRLAKHEIATTNELEAIFSNINDLIELTLTLIGSLEDNLEMAEEGKAPAVGTCFEELAEAEDFDVYENYARDILDPRCQRTLEGLLGRSEVAATLTSSGQGMKEAFKFYLPKLLLGPIYHCFLYFKKTEKLMKLTQSKEDEDSLKQVVAMITPLQTKLQDMIHNADPSIKRKNDIFYRSSLNRVSRQQQLQKLSQLQKSIDNWSGVDIASNSSKLVHEGSLQVLSNRNRNFSERYVFLLDGEIIICKQNRQHKTPLTSNANASFNLREKFLIRRVSVIDEKEDFNGSYNHEFDVKFAIDNKETKVTFKAETPEEKRSWMAVLVMLNTKSMLERTLDIYLENEEKKHPLRFPPCEKYRFAEPNSSKNIVFEDNERNSGVQQIKGATLVKLVERLTYHENADPMFMKTFLTTYRSFCKPNELLDLLIERFNIPDPEFSSDSESDSEMGDKTTKMRIAQDMKRFREKYSHPVQVRVFNVLKHWIDQHFYDFGSDHDLQHKLNMFLDSIHGKSMKKWVECISKIVQRRLSNEECMKEIVFDKQPPENEVHIVNAEPSWPWLLTYHPIEIARQLTLLHFQYYRAVKPSELVDLAWMGEDKNQKSPNLVKMSRHFTNFTNYIQKLIVDCENLEERMCVLHRSLEILFVLLELNNFNCVLAMTAALNSVAVRRIMQKVKDKLPNNLLKALQDGIELIQDHCRVYWEKLRSINPPCVPYYGEYQSKILFVQEGMKDFLGETSLINFTKRRKVSDIISEIQQYQNQPYCLKPCPEFREYLENLDPFPDMKDEDSEKRINDYLWKKSNEVEPRDVSKRKPDIERRWKNLDLRSPGIRPKRKPNPLPRIIPQPSESPINSPPFKSSPLSTPNTPIPHPNILPNPDPVKVIVKLPDKPTTSYNPYDAPPLPPKPKGVERRPDTSPPPPPLPPRQPPLPPRDRTTPIRGVLESRSPHMDPVEPRRENSHFFLQQNKTTQSPPPAVVPRRHSHIVNGSQSGHKYPPPPLLNLRAVSEGTAPSSSPGWGTEAPTIPPYRGPPLSASGRIQNPHHTDLNNSIGTMSITPNSGSTSGGQVGGGGTHFVFTEATPPPRPPRPTNQHLSTFEEAL